MKIDLSDCTFMIPVRIDSKDRQENLDLIVRYLKHHFDCKVIIAEESAIDFIRKMEPKLADGLVDEVLYYESYEPLFHRTKMLNEMTRSAKTSIVVNYDTDVLFPVQAYVDAANSLRNGLTDFVFPYLGRFYEVPRRFYGEIKNAMSISMINIADCGLNHPNSVGGAIFLNRQKFMESGGENENCKSWGWEDPERVSRWQTLGYKVGRVGEHLYHIEHWRGPNSGPSNTAHNSNYFEYQKVATMNKQQLENYIKSWSWKF